MSALHTACETEVKIGGNRYCFDASIVERISVREEDARFCKKRSVEVAENSSAESARATPRSGAGMWPLTYLEVMPNQENHLVSSVWLHVMETFSFACTKYVFGLRMCEDERRPLMNVDKHLEQKYSQETWISELQVQLPL
jgi:hypothetical protein